jgi:hypothetical protein
LGAWIVERLLSDAWVSKAALCGISSNQVAGHDAGFKDKWKTVAKCFLEGCWTDYPNNAVSRESAERYNCDFVALGYVMSAVEGYLIAGVAIGERSGLGPEWWRQRRGSRSEASNSHAE